MKAKVERIETLRWECLPTWKPKQQRRAYGVPMIDWHRQRRQGKRYCQLAAERGSIDERRD